MTDFMDFLMHEFGIYDALNHYKKHYPEWILFGVAVLACATVLNAFVL